LIVPVSLDIFGFSPTDVIFIVSVSVSITAVLVTVLYNRRTTRLSMLAIVFDHLFSGETRRMRYLVRERRQEFLQIKKNPEYRLPAELEDAGRYIASAYDRIGFYLWKHQRLTSDFLQWQGDVVLEMWSILGDWVRNYWRSEHIAHVKNRHPEFTYQMALQIYTNYFEWLQQQAESREDKFLKQLHKSPGHIDPLTDPGRSVRDTGPENEPAKTRVLEEAS